MIVAPSVTSGLASGTSNTRHWSFDHTSCQPGGVAATVRHCPVFFTGWRLRAT